MPPLINPGHSVAQRPQGILNFSFHILADTQQPFPGSHQDTQAIPILSGYMDRGEPAGTGELHQYFSIGVIGFGNPRRQSFTRLARI